MYSIAVNYYLRILPIYLYKSNVESRNMRSGEQPPHKEDRTKGNEAVYQCSNSLRKKCDCMVYQIGGDKCLAPSEQLRYCKMKEMNIHPYHHRRKKLPTCNH